MKDKEITLFLPMRQAMFEHLSSFMTVELAKKMFDVAALKINEENITDNLIRHQFPELHNADRLFWHRLSRMGFETEQLYVLSDKRFHKLLDKRIQEDIKWLDEELEEQNVRSRLQGSNENIILIKEDRAGEIRKSSWPRDQVDRIDVEHIPTAVYTEYLRFVQNYFAEVIETLERYKSGDFKIYIKTLFGEPELRDYIEDWDRFIRICDMLAEPSSFQNKPQQIIKKNSTTGEYIWRGLNDASMPSLGQFIIRLQKLSLIKYYRSQIEIARMFLRFFGIIDEFTDHNYLVKMMDTKIISPYSDEFSAIE